MHAKKHERINKKEVAMKEKEEGSIQPIKCVPITFFFTKNITKSPKMIRVAIDTMVLLKMLKMKMRSVKRNQLNKKKETKSQQKGNRDKERRK